MTERKVLQQIEEKIAELKSLLDAKDQDLKDHAAQCAAPIVVPDTIEPPITEREAEKFLNKSRQTLRMWRYAGIIKGYRINGRIYYKKSELLAALQEC